MNLSVPAQTLAGQPWKENGEVVMLDKVVANRLFVMDDACNLNLRSYEK